MSYKTRQDLQDDIYELQAELDRSKKLLGQCMERQINPPVMLKALDQEHLDLCCDEAIEVTHMSYRKILGRFYWKMDYGI
jgi:hypothetical protein|tara:strand:- start:1952 stop:2191 length:240 start_codon:yes stop_codon:yes gene_type:complete